MQNIEFSPECDCEPRCADQREHYQNNWWCPPCRWDYELTEKLYMLERPIEEYRTPKQIVGSHNAVHTKAGHPKPPDRPTNRALGLQQARVPEQLESEARLRARGLLPAREEEPSSDAPSRPASRSRRWTRDDLLIALGLYLRLPFGQLHQRHPEIIEAAELLGRTPSALAMKLVNLASLDDSRDQEGLPNASQADREIWAELQGDWSATAEAIAEAEAGFGIASALEIGDETFPVGEESIVQAKALRGRDQFRKAVLSAYEFRCCITGLAEPRLLEAAHIAPWRDDPVHGLNPTNGLCLSVLHHRAFDRGLIALDDDFRLLISPQLAAHGDEFVGTAFTPFAGKQIALPTKFAPNSELAAYHRERIFLASG